MSSRPFYSPLLSLAENVLDKGSDLILDHICRHLQGSAGSPGHYLLGLRVLNMLVLEMNQPTPGRTLTQHRKIAVSFRDLVRTRHTICA